MLLGAQGVPVQAANLAKPSWRFSGQANDPAALDVALVLAGIAPAYSGGPCHHLWHNRQTLGPQLQQQLGDAYLAVQQRLAASLTQEHTL